MALKIQLVTKPLSEIKADFIVLPIFEEEKPSFTVNLINDFLTDNPKFGKLFESQLLYQKDKKILLLGVGKKSKYSFETLQNWTGAAIKSLSTKAKLISLVLPKSEVLSAEECGEAIAIGAEIALYDPGKGYKSDYQNPKLISLEVVVERAEKGYQEGLRKGAVIGEAINLVRRLGDMPANEMTPNYFLDVVKKIAKEQKLKLTVLTESQAKKKGMGAFVGVAQGSSEPSYMMALEYKGDFKSKEKWGLVGKGITYDSGGVSLKPSDKLLEMKYDMLGAATVLATIMVVAKLGLKTNLVSVMPVTENMIGGKAFKPDDILRMYSGKTVEIITTDAEGRLVLADGLTFAQRDFKATKLIDIALLTGAVVIALGDFITGAFSNNSLFIKQLIEAGKKVGEKYWELPMDEEFDEMVKGKFADLDNVGHGGSIGTRTAGPTMGAKFLEAAIEGNKPWIHLDIGGTSTDMKDRSFRKLGATGVGVKTLVKLLES